LHYVQQFIDGYTDHNMPQEIEDYNSAFTYQVSSNDPLPSGDGGAIVRFGNYYYRTLINDNTGNDPIETLGTKWVRYGVSNAYAMLDLSAGSKSYFSEDYTTTGITQIVDLVIDDIVWVAILGSATGTELVYYKALTTRAGIDLDTEDFTNATNWELSSNSMVVEFERGDINTLVVGNYSSTFITVEHLDINGDVIPEATQVREHSTNDDVTDYFTYIYSAYSKTTGLDLAFKLIEIGEKIRVTFLNTIAGGEVSCGFLVGGIAQDMGDTKIGVGFSFNSYSVRSTDDFGVLTITKRGIQQLVDFETYIDSKSIAKTIQEVKGVYDDVMVFIVDPIENSLYDSIITLGVVDSVSTTLENPVQSIISWSIQETI